MRKKRKIEELRAKTGKPRGSPDKLYTHSKALLRALAVGVPITHACKAAGMAYRTYRDWFNLGAAGDPKYKDFHDKVIQAEGKFIESCMRRINTAGKVSWQANAWQLERTHPAEFALRKLEISGPEGRPIEVHDTGRDRLTAELAKIALRLKNEENVIDVTPRRLGE